MAKFKGVVKPCEVCGREMRRPQSQAHVRTYSTECGYKLRNAEYRRERVMVVCANCRGGFLTFPSHGTRRRFCSELCRLASPEYKAAIRHRVTGERNPAYRGATTEHTSAEGKRYRRSDRAVENAKTSLRRAMKHSATPKWADLDAIRAIYKMARHITERTGVRHHVDHIVPLRSAVVCGLHVETNLQVIPATENIKKHNRFT